MTALTRRLKEVLRLLRIILVRFLRLIGRLRRTKRRRLAILAIFGPMFVVESRACFRLVGEPGGVSQGFFRLCPLSAYAAMPQVTTDPNPAVITSGVKISIEKIFIVGTAYIRCAKCRVPVG